MGGLRRARGLRRRYAFLALLCLSLTLLGAFFFIRSLFTPDTGLIRYDPEVVVRRGAVLFFPSAPFTAPLAAGVLPDRDRILSLNGQGISNTRDLVRATLSVRSFAPFSLQVERDGDQVLTLHVSPYFRPARLDWIFELVFCLMLAVAAFILCWRMPHELSTIPLVLSVLLSLVFACIMPFSYESLAANLLANAGNISSWLLVIFAMFFPWRRGSRPVRRLVVGLVIVLYAAFCILRAWLFARWMATGLESLLADYRRLGQLVIVSDGAAYAALVVLLGSAYARSHLPRDKRMLQWMLAGVLIAFPPYFFLDQLPLILSGPVHQVGLGSLAQLFLSILPLFLLLALTRGTALNLRSFLIRYGIYGTLVVLTIGLFGVVYIPLKNYLSAAYRFAAPLPELFAAGILVVTLGVLRLPVEHLFSRARGAKPEGVGMQVSDGLHALIQLTHEDTRAFHSLRLTETRSIIRGIVRALHEPVRVLAAGAARSGTVEQKEAGTEATFFLQTLESLAGSPSSPSRFSAPEEIARAAVERVRAKYPHTEFTQLGEGGGLFLCRYEELVQAVSLLLENAAEAKEDSRAGVRIRWAEDRSRVVIEIADEGPGIDALARRRLFKPFFSTKPGHRGLGLYFARIIVERNEGGIEFTTGESGGTIVRLAFPGTREESAGYRGANESAGYRGAEEG
jgi:signal transduction histidine kinase